jgi:hypothetical protein
MEILSKTIIWPWASHGHRCYSLYMIKQYLLGWKLDLVTLVEHNLCHLKKNSKICFIVDLMFIIKGQTYKVPSFLQALQRSCFCVVNDGFNPFTWFTHFVFRCTCLFHFFWWLSFILDSTIFWSSQSFKCYINFLKLHNPIQYIVNWMVLKCFLNISIMLQKGPPLLLMVFLFVQFYAKMTLNKFLKKHFCVNHRTWIC